MVSVPRKAQDLFDAAVDAIIGNGEKALFCTQVVGWPYHG
jgi:hypothetical protein